MSTIFKFFKMLTSNSGFILCQMRNQLSINLICTLLFIIIILIYLWIILSNLQEKLVYLS